METNFNFESQVCTSRSQSEKLLELGLKKETRDVVLKKYIHNDKYCYKPIFEDIEDRLIDCDDLYPAWSLHRLIKLAYGNWKEDIAPIYLGNSYDMLIGRIEFQIKQGKFNKEYLV